MVDLPKRLEVVVVDKCVYLHNPEANHHDCNQFDNCVLVTAGSFDNCQRLGIALADAYNRRHLAV